MRSVAARLTRRCREGQKPERPRPMENPELVYLHVQD
jgi:hypothetical protein